MQYTMDRVFRFSVILALFAFAGIGIAAAQDLDPPEPPPVDETAWISWLSASFSVEAATLQSYVDEGYRVMDLRFALELSEASGKSLSEVLEIAGASTTGRGWGVIAQSLGVDPGSEAFHQIRETHRPSQADIETYGLMLWVNNREHSGDADGDGEPDGEMRQERVGRGDSPGGPGEGPGGRGEGPGHRGGKGGSGGR